MASDFAVAYSAPPRFGTPVLAPAAFVALMLLIFVGFNAFDPPPLVSAFGGVKEASHGDILRQLAYLGVAALVVINAMRRRGLGALRAVPLSMAILLLWCLASALWAAEPNVVIRRAGLEVVIALSILLSMDTMGAEKAFTWWRWMLAAVLLLNFISLPLIPEARHLAGEHDPALIGNWRGLYGHKNIAGAVCAITIILFMFTKTGWKNWIGIAISLAALVFLIGTKSKSSLGFLPVALLAGLLYRYGWRDGLSRAILASLGVLVVLALGTLALLDADSIARMLENPAEFTGRAAIWAAEFRYIADHPLLGAGFGTFTDTGGLSPLHNYVSGSWVEEVSHGHNGYLQLAVTIGGIGLLLTLLAAVAWPMRRFWELDMADNAFKPMLFALFVFLVLHNFMESDMLEGDSGTWAALLMMLAGLNAGRMRRLRH